MYKGLCVWKVDTDKSTARIGCTDEVVGIDGVLPLDGCPRCGNEVEIFEGKTVRLGDSIVAPVVTFLTNDTNGDERILAPEADEVRDHRYVTEELTQIFKNKNLDYGNSFEQSLDKHGMIASIVRMEDKLNRLTNLYDEDTSLVDETLEDTIMDLANYAIMTAMWVKDNKED